MGDYNVECWHLACRVLVAMNFLFMARSDLGFTHFFFAGATDCTPCLTIVAPALDRIRDRAHIHRAPGTSFDQGQQFDPVTGVLKADHSGGEEALRDMRAFTRCSMLL